MPTRFEFEAAAETFIAAVDLVRDLVVAASGAGAAQVLQGGSLGRQVPERIAAAGQTANICCQVIAEAAATCAERAGIIAAYEIDLGFYDIAVGSFQQALQQWAVQYSAWAGDETGLIFRPDDPPPPPAIPVAPPAWADVRRP